MKAQEILKKRRDRGIAIVLKVKEREVDPLLLQEPGGAQASRLLRKVILDQMNDFYDLALDVCASGEAETFWFNPEVWMRRLDEIHQAVVEQ
jgi:hypothetical protein